MLQSNSPLIYLVPLLSPTQSLFSSSLGFCVSLFSLKEKKKITLKLERLQRCCCYHFIYPLLLQSFSLPYLFIFPLPSTLISFFLFPFIFLYFCLFLFTSSYYKFVIISSILYIVFSHQKTGSLSLYRFFGGFFYFIFLASLL